MFGHPLRRSQVGGTIKADAEGAEATIANAVAKGPLKKLVGNSEETRTCHFPHLHSLQAIAAMREESNPPESSSP